MKQLTPGETPECVERAAVHMQTGGVKFVIVYATETGAVALSNVCCESTAAYMLTASALRMMESIHDKTHMDNHAGETVQ